MKITNYYFFLNYFLTEKVKRAQKVQATQTEIARDASPATPHKSKSISQKTVTKKISQPHASPKSVAG